MDRRPAVALVPNEPVNSQLVDFDRSKSILQLKREKFRDPFWDFYLFPSGFWLRKVPLHNLTETDMWVLIRQSIGLDYVVLLAIERLEVDPLVKCKQRAGDLLSAVFAADALVWKRNPHYRQRLMKLWPKVSVRLLASKRPETQILFSDYRWFVRAGELLPKDDILELPGHAVRRPPPFHLHQPQLGK